jgi:RNA polymerase sigma factor (sigma-70 family)
MYERSDIQLLCDYVEHGREAAFRELVTRHTDLVYSAALRQMNSVDLAQEITQSVFVDLARKSRQLVNQRTAGNSLAGWLHRGTRYAALNQWRNIQRRRMNEKQAMEQLLIDSESTPEWENIRPLLDEALDSLDDKDREVLLLRFFKKQDFRTVGLAMGISDDTAQKRASRALEQLREFFLKRNIGTGGLAWFISTSAVHSAPVGLATTIAGSALTIGSVPASSSSIATTKIIAMTALQKTIVTVTVAALAGVGIYQAHQASKLREENQVLQRQQAALADEIQQLRSERKDETNSLAALRSEVTRLKKNPSEVSKLRDEVGTLRKEKAVAENQNTISKALANPQTRKSLREFHKSALVSAYSPLINRLQLTPEQATQFNDTLADHAMDNIDLIVQALREGKSQAEVREIFSRSDAAFEERVRALLGDQALAQFQDYTKNLGSTIFVNAFAMDLTGDPATRADKKNQLLRAMEEATQSVLADAGLPANYQTLTTANPCNFVSQDEAAYNIQLKDTIFAQTALRARAFLSAEELNKFQERRAEAIKNSQNYIAMEQALLAPASQ